MKAYEKLLTPVKSIVWMGKKEKTAPDNANPRGEGGAGSDAAASTAILAVELYASHILLRIKRCNPFAVLRQLRGVILSKPWTHGAQAVRFPDDTSQLGPRKFAGVSS